ncbi:hypothetical protein SC206_04830 [Rouxiella sp. T17]|uniref:hypothetical protein n=1 Tax=Rouxiella sp. T17 TaxID=3085684 RepID=UPI002FCBB29A
MIYKFKKWFFDFNFKFNFKLKLKLKLKLKFKLKLNCMRFAYCAVLGLTEPLRSLNSNACALLTARRRRPPQGCS